MPILKNPVFLISSLLFLFHQFSQKVVNYPIPLLDNYLDTLLCMPILLSLLLLEQRQLFKKGAHFRFNAIETIFLVLLLSVLFERLFPWLSPNFTADWWDVLMYLIGGSIFYYFINK